MTLSIRQVAIWLGLIIGLCYVGSLHGTFHFDDSHSVESNIAIRSLANIPTFWTDSRTSSFIPENRVYRPLVYTFYSFCWLFGGGQTWPFHIMKMLMHLSVCLALFSIWRRLWREPGWFPVKSLKLKFPLVSHVFQITPDWAAFFLAAIFAIHPAGSECVDYISATTSLQCAMFYLWAYYAYLRFRDSGDKRHLALSLFIYFLSVASKEEGITLPAMVGVTELFLGEGKGSRRVWGAVRQAIPFGLLGLALAAWIFAMHPTEGNESRGWATPFQYFITQWRAYLFYMRIWFWPWDLNADNASMEFSHSITEPLALQAMIGNLLVIAFSWFNRKRFPAMLFGLIWFYVTIAPASSVVVLAEAINEHRMYLAYIGFVGGTFTVLLWCLENFLAAETRPRMAGALLSLAVLGLVVGTQERNRVWANDENLWLDTVEKNPTSGRALNNLALVYLARGEYQSAVGYLQKCEQYWATYMYCPLNLGISYHALGKFEEAEKSLQRAYQLNPRSVHVNFHLGKFFEEQKKDYAKAIDYYRTSIDLTGGRYAAAEQRVADCYEKLKKFDDARAALGRALTLEPANTGALFQLGRIENLAGNNEAAVADYDRLLAMEPNHLQAWYNLGVARVAQGRFAEARKAFERTVEIDPKSEQGWYNLAYAAERLRDGAGAIAAARQLAAINPSKAEYQSRLHELERKLGGKSEPEEE